MMFTEPQIEKLITLDSFIGQQKNIDILKTSILSSKMYNEQLHHILLVGPIGSGKKTLANAVVSELNAQCRNISFNVIKRDSDLVAILTSVNNGDVIIAENIDAIKSECAKILGSAMEDYFLDVIIGKGTAARSVRIDLPQFTLIAMMTSQIKLPESLGSCFPIRLRMDEYSHNDMKELVKIHAKDLKITIVNEAVEIIASFAEGSHQKLLNMLKRARDFAIVKNNGVISCEIANLTIESLMENEF